MDQESGISKIERFLFYIFLFCIPFQTRIILSQWTRPFNEWTASFLYLTDILLAAVLILWAIRWFLKKKKDGRVYDIMIYHKLPIWGWMLLGFFVVSTISIFRAGIVGLAIFRLIKLGELILLFLYIRASAGKIFKLKTAAAVITVSGFFQAVVAIIQYAKQGSMGLKILGESQIGVDVYNVAVFIASNGVKYMRAYGTTPHPNVLAAWLALALFTFYFWYSSWAGSARATPARAGVTLAIYVVILFGFLFTFSRTMIGLWGLTALAAFIFLKNYRKRFNPVILTTLAVGVIFCIFFWPQVRSRILISGDEEAVTQRILYNEIAGGVTKTNPLLGVGIGQSVVDLMHRFRYYPQYFYQPTHNIYLLISSETGFLGLIFFLLFIFFLFWEKIGLKTDGRRRARPPAAIYPLLIVSYFLLSGLFDHFLWTLQQGSFILWLSLVLLTIKTD
ncbi:MAG: O-antigen ligase family protein [Minisyncoccia bacterium]